MRRLDFRVRRDDFRQHEVVEAKAADELAEGQVLLRVDRFALTSNNISYAAAGDALDYWGFFPADAGWGRIPAMGFGEVAASAHPEVAEGGRYFGFYPMSTHLVVAARPGGDGFADTAAHRAQHAPVYRQYASTTQDALYAADAEAQLILLRGLFLTSFLAEDFIEDNQRFGAEALLISSASSKTSIALAHQASKRGALRVVGLTSARNRSFVESLGCYDEVVEYAALESIPSARAAVFVDMAGNADVVRRLHEHLGERLRHDCVIGATHWEAPGDAAALPGPRREFFFAPSQIVKRTQEWGAAELQQRLGRAWQEFRASTDAWLVVVEGHGPKAVEAAYQRVLRGEARPHEGHVLSLFERGAADAG